MPDFLVLTVEPFAQYQRKAVVNSLILETQYWL